MHNAVDPLEAILRESESAMGQEAITQVEFSVGRRLGVTTSSGFFGALAVEGQSTIQIPTLEVEPSEAVEKSVANELITRFLG